VALLSEGELIGVRTLSIGLSRAGGFPTFLQELRWTLMALGGDELGMPSRFFLCGGGARIPRLRKELEQALDSEILPLQDLFLPPVPEELRHEQGVFAACLGIGLNEALGLSAPRINVRRGSFTHQGQREGLRREFAQLTWVVTGVALAAGLAFALELHRLNTQYEGLRREIRQVFTATLPEVQSIVSEKVQLEDAVATLRGRQRLIGGAGGVSPLDILRQLSAALPDQITVDLDEWTFDTETIRMRGTTSSFDAAETIKTTAAQLGLFQEVQLKDVKTIASGKKVSFGLQMTLGQEGR
jgi:general secretion pathway protein L